MSNPLLCPNFEIIVGPNQSGSAVTFALDDLLPALIPTFIRDVHVYRDRLLIEFSDDAQGAPLFIEFPFTSTATYECFKLIKEKNSRLFIAALGTSGGIAFAREMAFDLHA